jgi:hypothetical protein
MVFKSPFLRNWGGILERLSVKWVLPFSSFHLYMADWVGDAKIKTNNTPKAQENLLHGLEGYRFDINISRFNSI